MMPPVSTLHVEFEGRVYRWDNLDEQLHSEPGNWTSFINALRENIEHHLGVPYDLQAISDDFGPLESEEDFARAFSGASQRIVVQMLDSRPPAVRAPSHPRARPVKVEQGGRFFEWDNILAYVESEELSVLQSTLAENIQQHFHIPVECQLWYDQEGPIDSCADLIRMLKGVEPFLRIVDTREHPAAPGDKTWVELRDQLSSLVDLMSKNRLECERQLTGVSARLQQGNFKTQPPAFPNLDAFGMEPIAHAGITPWRGQGTHPYGEVLPRPFPAAHVGSSANSTALPNSSSAGAACSLSYAPSCGSHRACAPSVPISSPWDSRLTEPIMLQEPVHRALPLELTVRQESPGERLPLPSAQRLVRPNRDRLPGAVRRMSGGCSLPLAAGHVAATAAAKLNFNADVRGTITWAPALPEQRA